MASIIEGYTYDIFISYRQKDNKYDGWVTEFVDNLKKELEATFKEEVSVYFDINPHDGLLETHDVDESLKDKLMCLVFIPIISRTYCDPKSFAWEHELRAFVEMASQDQFGLKVKLPNGNVASRVLPVRIYDLDTADIKLCESVLGGVLRGVEFIYKSAGVNRPLRSMEEKPYDNLNKTIYRDQINKVANAIKEIISGLRAGEFIPGKEKPETAMPWEEVRKVKGTGEPGKREGFNRWKLLSGLFVTTILIIAAILAFPKIFKRDKLDKLVSPDGRISVAVMPFLNMTNDTTKHNWQNFIQDNIIYYLSNSEELNVRQSAIINSYMQGIGLTNYASITRSVASSISQKLEANVLVYGSIMQDGATIRFNTQLINSKTEEVIKSFQNEVPARQEKVFPLIDSISAQVNNYLIISILKKDVAPTFQSLMFTKSPEAYRYFTLAINASYKKRDPAEAIKWFKEAIRIDSNSFMAKTQLASTYRAQGNINEAKKWILQVYKKKDQMPVLYQVAANLEYAIIFETPYEEIKYATQYLELDDQNTMYRWQLGRAYAYLDQHDKAIQVFEKTFEILDKLDVKPTYMGSYAELGKSYHIMGKYKKEKKLYKKAEHDFPDYPGNYYRQAVLALSKGDETAANRYIEKYTSIRKGNSESEANIMQGLAGIYSEANLPDKAEEYYRKALALDPDNPQRWRFLAYFLIDKNRNIKEGLELAERGLKRNPTGPYFLDCKGWGLYKLGQYREALEILQKSWDSMVPILGYDHQIFVHLEAAKKAVAGQKGN